MILADSSDDRRSLPRVPEKEARLKKAPAKLFAVRRRGFAQSSDETVFAAGLDLEPLRELFVRSKPFIFSVSTSIRQFGIPNFAGPASSPHPKADLPRPIEAAG